MRRSLLVLLVLFTLSACNISASGDQAGSTLTRTTTPVTVLGSPLTVFEARFGEAEQAPDQADYYTIAPNIMGPDYSFEVKNGRVTDLTIDILPNTSSGKKYCYSFLPPDSKLLKSVYGFGDVYLSKTLSKEFSPTLFTDVGDTTAFEDPLPATPGTLTVSFETDLGYPNAICHVFLGR